MFYLGKLGEIHDISQTAMAAAMAQNHRAGSVAPQVTNLTSVSSVIALLQSAERAAASATNVVADKAVSGKVPTQYVAGYDGLRHALQAAQRAVLAQLRESMASQFSAATSNGIMARIDFPAWLPRADFMVSVSRDQPPTFVAAEAAMAIQNLPSHFADTTVLSFVQPAALCIIAIGIAMAVKAVVRGESSSGSGAPTAADLAAFSSAEGLSRKAKLLISIPVVVGALALGGAIWWFIRRRKKSVRGIGRTQARRSLRGATKLTSLTDSTPSRYQLEV